MAPPPDAATVSSTPPRLGCYVLPGGVADPRLGVTQAAEAEALGLDAVWVGERYDTKDLPSLIGAMSQKTHQVKLGAAITHIGLRHPMVLASMGQTLQALSDGRFRFGFGRSANWRWRAYGVAPPTLQTMADTIGIIRQLWAGQTVSYDGPAGTFPQLRLPQRPDVAPPPALLAAVGPKTLRLAGDAFDGVILHPFLSPAAVRRSVVATRDASVAAGKAPTDVRCIATVVVAPDRTPTDTDLAVGARAAGYFSVEGLGDALIRANEWDPDELARYRNHPTLVALNGQPADKALTRPQLVELSRTLPDGWLSSSSAVGDVAACASKLGEYLDAGADEIIVHGTTAGDLGGLIDAFRGAVVP